MMDTTIKVSERTAEMLERVCGKSDYSLMMFVENAIDRQIEITSEFQYLHEHQDDYLCKHKHLELKPDGTYECSVCGRNFEIQIPF